MGTIQKMSAKVAIQISETLFHHIQGIAQRSNRSVEELLTATLTISLPPISALPDNLTHELAEMIWLSDQALWTATRPSFLNAEQHRLAELNDLNDDRSLTAQEETERHDLLAQYDRALLLRAQAFAILARRGHSLPNYSELSYPE